MNQLTHISAEV